MRKINRRRQKIYLKEYADSSFKCVNVYMLQSTEMKQNYKENLLSSNKTSNEQQNARWCPQTILSILFNKRYYSDFTDEDFEAQGL